MHVKLCACICVLCIIYDFFKGGMDVYVSMRMGVWVYVWRSEVNLRCHHFLEALVFETASLIEPVAH